ncbi:class I SAM-dependent methyltransferase [Vibrio ostreicida]|uniref:class I SAM-dependent methyltransferase n=1 Tax=Vibrio ostreicida TaxID=526588 RepID=UPI003B5AB652
MINAQTLPYPKPLSAIQKTSRSLIVNFLSRLSFGALTLIESYQEEPSKRVMEFGQTGGLHAVIDVKDPDFYVRLLKGGSISAGEAYMDGWWDSPDLTTVIEVMALNLKTMDAMAKRNSLLARLSYKWGHWFNRNTQKQAEANISAHYDLSNDLYSTFLDDEMLYSAACFEQEYDTLEQAQINKMMRLCKQLKLTSTDHVIEIGTGWGAMAIFMAENFGCKVTTTTISQQQYEYTKTKIRHRGLEGQITLLKQDYRVLKGTFDKLVSIEMIEAVGKDYLQSYIEKCQSLLRPSGLMAIQAITIADQRYDYYSSHVDFIQKYIFPGGFLPSVTALTQATTKHSDLILRDLFDIGLDYAQTLKEWRKRFNAAEGKVREFGFDERFIRMWNYYFCYCEGGFNAKRISTVHMTFEKP